MRWFLVLAVLMMAASCGSQTVEVGDEGTVPPFSPSTSYGANYMQCVPAKDVVVVVVNQAYPPDGEYTLHLTLEQDGEIVEQVSQEIRVERP